MQCTCILFFEKCNVTCIRFGTHTQTNYAKFGLNIMKTVGVMSGYDLNDFKMFVKMSKMM